MKKISKFDQSDFRRLSQILRFRRVVYTNTEIQGIKDRYSDYSRCGGDPFCINPVAYAKEKHDDMASFYDTTTAEASALKQTIRYENGLKSCPMCGGFNTFTIDHHLPKSIFPEFSIYANNLIPCCSSCNGMKNDVYVGGVGERMLHPYYDDVLDQRILKVHLGAWSGEVPAIEIVLTDYANQHPLVAAIRFHRDNVVLKTPILSRLSTEWTDLIRNPRRSLALRSRTVVSQDQIQNELVEFIEDLDFRFGSVNNWLSLFYVGVNESWTARNIILKGL